MVPSIESRTMTSAPMLTGSSDARRTGERTYSPAKASPALPMGFVSFFTITFGLVAAIPWMSAGQVLLLPSQNSAGSQTFIEFLQSVAAGSTASAGHVVVHFPAPGGTPQSKAPTHEPPS